MVKKLSTNVQMTTSLWIVIMCPQGKENFNYIKVYKPKEQPFSRVYDASIFHILNR